MLFCQTLLGFLNFVSICPQRVKMATQNLHHFKIKTNTEEETIRILWSQVRKRCWKIPLDHISSVQSLIRIQLFATPWTVARQASLSITNSWSSLKLKSIESVMPSSHLILCRPLLLLPNPSQHQGLFQWVSSSHEVAKGLEFQLQHQSSQRTLRTDLP